MLSLCAHVTLLVNVVEDGEDRELLEASHTPHHPVRGWEPLMGRPTSTRGALDLELSTLDCIATILASGLGYKMLLQYSNKMSIWQNLFFKISAYFCRTIRTLENRFWYFGSSCHPLLKQFRIPEEKYFVRESGQLFCWNKSIYNLLFFRICLFITISPTFTLKY